MKKIFFYLVLLVTPLLTQCDDDDNDSAAQALPEATQTGRGIFACYVNGKPFIDTSGDPNGISFNCFYQNVDGEYYFGIQGEDRVESIVSVGLFSTNISIQEGSTYILSDNISNNFFGSIDFNPSFNVLESSLTNINYMGEIYITKFDIENQIVSGTFWFNIQNPSTGEKVEIREGRFDTRFGL